MIDVECTCKSAQGIVQCSMTNETGIKMSGKSGSMELSVEGKLFGVSTKDPECIRREVGFRFRNTPRDISAIKTGDLEMLVGITIPIKEPTEPSSRMGKLCNVLHDFGIGLWDASDNCGII